MSCTAVQHIVASESKVVELQHGMAAMCGMRCPQGHSRMLCEVVPARSFSNAL